MTWSDCGRKKKFIPSLNLIRSSLWDLMNRRIKKIEKTDDDKLLIHFSNIPGEFGTKFFRIMIKAENIKCKTLGDAEGKVIDVAVSWNSIVLILDDGVKWIKYSKLHKIYKEEKFFEHPIQHLAYSEEMDRLMQMGEDE